METKPSKTKIFLKMYPHHPLYHISLPSQKELICDAKVIEGPEAPEDLHW